MTRKEAMAAKAAARAAGVKTYESAPCKYGHTRRYTGNGTCVQCSRNHSARQYRARVQGYMATVEPLDHVAATARISIMGTMGAVESRDVAAVAIRIEQTAEQKLFDIMSASAAVFAERASGLDRLVGSFSRDELRRSIAAR